MSKKNHYYDIDWLRVLGMLTIFLFHNAMFFSEDYWHVKNFKLDFSMSVFVSIINHFIMPLFFILSAIATYYALKKRNNLEFMRERFIRLIVPLGVGIFSHIIIQVFIENITHNRFSGTFCQFIPHYFDGWYGFGGNFAWMGLHLWYLLILFLFSGLMLPLFQLINRSQDFTTKLSNLVNKPFGLYLFIIPLFLMEFMVSLSPQTIGRRDFGGWSPLTYLIFFIIGYLLTTDERYRTATKKVRFISLTLSLLTVIVGYILLVKMRFPNTNLFYLLVRVTNSWSWLITFIGFANHYLNFNNLFLKYANEAVLPFYILHQTVIVVIGYFIRNWNWAIFPKYLFLVTTSFIIIITLYEFAIKRVSILRYLFGMKD
ncbi:acyltransferase family protein [Candidatus Poribacteria bacterium]|nr:acyltransferase family protein [Candidatus Poribacteria bacterium]